MFAIDISHHNGEVIFPQVLSNDPRPDFVYIKATQGVGYTDPRLKSNAQAAYFNGFDIGYYHYASLNTLDVVQDATSEAKYFIDTIRTLPAAKMPLALDIEENKANVPKDKVLIWIQTFFQTLHTLGYSDYILYSYTSFLDSNLPKNHGLGSIPLWIAAYVNKAKPVLPKGWSEYFIWQYSAKGKVKGINSDTDLNKTFK